MIPDPSDQIVIGREFHTIAYKKKQVIKSPARIVVVLVSTQKRALPFPKVLVTNICELLFNTGPNSCFVTLALLDVFVGAHISVP